MFWRETTARLTAAHACTEPTQTAAGTTAPVMSAVQLRPLTRDCGKSFGKGQGIQRRCYTRASASMHIVCCESSWSRCVTQRSVPSSLEREAFMNPVVVKRRQYSCMLVLLAEWNALSPILSVPCTETRMVHAIWECEMFSAEATKRSHST